jgi:NTP pyrophosphatase (non-canonical NTP hydrolase)
MPEPLSLAGLQRYVEWLESDRGFDQQTILDKCLLLGEEVGELFKAVRKSSGLAIDAGSQAHEVADELADILIFLASIANRAGVDLDEALRAKEAVNSTRTWEPD